MAKLKADPITSDDLAEYVKTASDFEFEMAVLRELKKLGFQCQHTGTYQDPLTGKIRQFDIRATMDTANSTLALSVECKNLRTNFPLLISTTPRTLDEAFHPVIDYNPSGLPLVTRVDTIRGIRSVYRPAGDGRQKDRSSWTGSGK